MKTFRLNKLVRDGIVLEMERSGQIVSYEILGKHEYIAALRDKLLEEMSEFDAYHQSALEELADIEEVLRHLVAELDPKNNKFEKIKSDKAAKMGVFKKRIFVESVSLEDNDPWAAYYEKEPERFPSQN